MNPMPRMTGTTLGPTRTVACVAAVLAAAPLAAQAPPAADIWLVDIAVRNGRVQLGTPVNVTARPGYDNQPAFLTDGSGFYYTRIEDGQADVWRYDIAARRSVQITHTPESEYSPQPLRSDSGFSVVRVEADSAQRLWRFAPDGSAPAVILPDLEPVGYYAWAGRQRVAAFLLGDPNALVVANVATGRADTMARDIGRSLQPIPGRPAATFVQWVSAKAPWLAEVDVSTRAILRLIELPRGAEFHAWLPHGIVIAAVDTKLYEWAPLRGGRWRQCADLKRWGLRGSTRLAVSPDGTRLAIVAVAAN